MAVVGLADGDVARRQICQHRGAGEGPEGAWRNRRPHVFADLDADREAWQVPAGEEHVGAERHAYAGELERRADELAGGAKLALLVVLVVLRQIALGHDSEDPAAVDRHRAVEQAALGPQRCADEEQWRERS